MARAGTIRQRLTRRLMLAVGAVILLGGLGTYLAVRHILMSEFDYALLARARALTGFSERGRAGVNLNFVYAGLPEFEPGAPEYFQLWLRDTNVLAKSRSLGEAELPHPEPGIEPEFQIVRLPGGEPVRVVGLNLLFERVQPLNPGVATHSFALAFGRDLTQLRDSMREVLAGIVLAGLALVAATFLIARRVIDSGLRPLAELARQVQGVSAQSLGKRLGLAVPTGELNPIVEEFNALLKRISVALERERRFTANAAHELLTPIAELRALAEAATRWGDDPQATVSLASDSLQISRQMQRTVELLQALARSEAGLLSVKREEVDLSALINEAKGRLAAEGAAKQLQTKWEVPPGVAVWADRALLQSIVNNLLENSLDHCPDSGLLECRLREVGDRAEWTLRNTNPGLTTEDIPHLFEPFWRKDTARADRAHTGLGLALVSAFANAMGVTIEAGLQQPDWFEVKVGLPKKPNAPAAPAK